MKSTKNRSHLRVVEQTDRSLLDRLSEALDNTEDGSRDEEILEELQEIRGLLQVLLRREAGMQTALPPRRAPHLYSASTKGHPFTRSGRLPAKTVEESDALRTLESMITLYEDARREFAS